MALVECSHLLLARTSGISFMAADEEIRDEEIRGQRERSLVFAD